MGIIFQFCTELVIFSNLPKKEFCSRMTVGEWFLTAAQGPLCLVPVLSSVHCFGEVQMSVIKSEMRWDEVTWGEVRWGGSQPHLTSTHSHGGIPQWVSEVLREITFKDFSVILVNFRQVFSLTSPKSWAMTTSIACGVLKHNSHDVPIEIS